MDLEFDGEDQIGNIKGLVTHVDRVEPLICKRTVRIRLVTS